MAISLEPSARPQAAAAAGAGMPPPAAPNATETRLRLIIESAPVSLTVTTNDGTILAANARALRLFGVERLENLVGTKFDRVVAADDRAVVMAAVDSVCKGGDAHLTYHVANGESAGRVVEMRAVPLRRDGAGTAVCLGATWEVADTPASAQPAGTASAPGIEQALEDAKTALATMTRTREAERLAVGDALLQTRQRMQAALADAEERHAQAATQWSAERDALQSELHQARDAAGSGASQLSALTNEIKQAHDAANAAVARFESSQAELSKARDAAAQAASQLHAREGELVQARDAASASSTKLTAVQGELTQAREAATAASAQLAAVSADLAQTREAAMMTAAQLAASNDQRLRAEDALEASRYRVAELEAIVHELEERCAQVVADRQADRIEFHEMVRTEQSKYDALVAHQAQREAALADISRLLQDAALRTERLLGDNHPAVAPAAPQMAAEPMQPEPQSAAPASGMAEEDPWQF